MLFARVKISALDLLFRIDEANIGKSDDLRESIFCRNVVAMPAPRRCKNKQHTARGAHITLKDPNNALAILPIDDRTGRSLTHLCYLLSRQTVVVNMQGLRKPFRHVADAATPRSRSVDNDSVDKLFQERFTSLNHLSS